MNDKINITPEQFAEVKAFFQQNDFTANMAVEREYNMTGDKAKAFARQKRFSVNTGSEIFIQSA